MKVQNIFCLIFLFLLPSYVMLGDRAQLTLKDLKIIMESNDLNAQYQLLREISNDPILYEDVKGAPGSELSDEIQRYLIEHFIQSYPNVPLFKPFYVRWWNNCLNLFSTNREQRMKRIVEIFIVESHLIARFHQPDYADQLVVIHPSLVPPETYGEVAAKSLINNADIIMNSNKAQRDSFLKQVRKV